MNSKIKTISIILGSVAIAFIGLILVGGIFLSLLNTKVTFNNDTQESVKVTALLQDHDNGNFYLSKHITLEPNEQKNLSIGLQFARCLYIAGTNLDTSIPFDEFEFERSETYPRKVYVDVSTLIDESDACPLDQSRFREGSGNAIEVPRNEWP